MDQFETQARIMQQSNLMHETIKDLYNWEKEIKQMEKQMKPVDTNEIFESTYPIRSHVASVPQSTSGIISTNETTKNNQIINVPKSSGVPQNTAKANEFKTRGNDCVKLGQYQKAIHYYTESIRLNKFDPIYFSNRALCYLKLNKFPECIEDCTIAIQLDEKCVKAYYRRMLAHEQCNHNLVAALKDCENVLRLEPKNVDAKKGLERIKNALKQNKENDSSDDLAAATAERKDRVDNENFVLRAAATSTIKLPKKSIEQAPWSQYEKQENYEKIDFIQKAPHLRSKEAVKRIDIQEISSTTLNRPIDVAIQLPVISNSSSYVEKKILANKSNDDDAHTKNAKNVKTNVEIPQSTAQFHRIWHSANDDQQRYEILKGIYDKDISKMLGSQFDVNLLSELLSIIKKCFIPNNQPIVGIMCGIVSNMEMSIISLLMNDEDKLAFTKLITYMRSIHEDADKIEFVQKKFENYLAL